MSSRHQPECPHPAPRRTLVAAADLLLALLLVPTGPARAAEHLRAPYLSFAVGYEPTTLISDASLGPADVAAGDLNGDGRADLAVVLRDRIGIEGGSYLSILFADPNPSLPRMTTQTLYKTSLGPARVAMGDLDNDADLDVVTADGGSDSMSVFLNQGYGTLKMGPRAFLGAEPLGLVLADLNGDGRRDAVVPTVSGLKVLLSSGLPGSFASPVTYSPPSGSVEAAGLGDLDGDGVLDLVVATASPNTLTLYFGDGTGAFSFWTAPSLPYAPVALELADMTGDGTLDAVVASSAFARLTVLPSDLGSPFAYVSADVWLPFGPMDLVARDLDGDGDIDIAAALNSTGSFSTGEILLGNGTGGFSGNYEFDFGPNLEAIAAGDFDGDGRADLAACGAGPVVDFKFQRAVNVALQLGVGGGSFDIGADYKTFAVGTTACTVVAVDMNRDGKDDLVVAGVDAQASITIRPGNGDGTWATASALVVPGDLPPGVVPSDFNRDGKPDLVVTSRFSSAHPNTQTYLGNGDGTITPLATWSVGADALACGDFDRDGRLDLVLADPITYQVLLYRGHGDGTFVSASSSPAFAYLPTAAAVGDLNRDGQLDLVVLTSVASEAVLLGNGDGTLQAPVTVGGGTFTLTLADLDRDGILDLADPYPRHGNGDGTFGSPVALHVSKIDPLPNGIVASDVNRDGKADLIYSLNDASGSLQVVDSRVDVWLGNGAMEFGARTGYGTGRFALGLSPVDADRDGRGDVIAVDRDPFGSGTPALLTLRGNGPSYAFPTSRPTTPTPSSAWAMATADFTMDGTPDAVIGRSDASGDYATLLVGNGDGTFTVGSSKPVPPEPFALAAGDLNRDGIPDLAIACGAGDAVLVAMGTPEDSLAAPVAIVSGSGYEFSDIAIGDFNRDGKPDLAAASAATDLILVFLGNGDGTFGAPAAFSTGSSGPVSIAVGDTNRDGRQDLVAALGSGFNPSTVVVLRGIGDGTFDAARPYSCGATPRALALADLNRDGVLDAAVTLTGNAGSRYVSVLLGQAGGGFGAATTYPITGNAFDILVVDIDGNGIPDLVAPNGYFNDTLAFLHGTGLGTFEASVDYYFPGSPVALASEDFNQDGRPDILGGLSALSNVTVYLSSPSTVSGVVTGPAADAPRAPRLTVRPNPASGQARLEFALPAPGRARVELFDVRGRRVARLFDGRAEGAVEVRWDGTVEHGGRAASGVYFARVTSEHAAVSRRIVWTR